MDRECRTYSSRPNGMDSGCTGKHREGSGALEARLPAAFAAGPQKERRVRTNGQARACRPNRRRVVRHVRVAVSALVVASLAGGMIGCEANSFFDPSTTGSWKNTPTVMPILDRL